MKLVLTSLFLLAAFTFTCCNGVPYLPYIDFNAIPNHGILTGVDDDFRAVALPSLVTMGTNHTDIAYVGSNGLVSFGVPFNSFLPKTFPIDYTVVAPYWDDIDMRATGRLRYAIVESDLPAVLQDISEYISTSQNTVFNADWALLAEWMNVCPFNNSLCLNVDPNTFQVIVTTDSTSTYSIFTYKCGDLNWIKHSATVGYSMDRNFFKNHPLSGSVDINGIACLNQPQSIWSNVVNKLSVSYLPMFDLTGIEAIITTGDDNSEPVQIPLPLPFGVDNSSHSTVFISTNGLVSFDVQFTGFKPIPFPGLSVPIIAPYWNDIRIDPPSKVVAVTIDGSSTLADNVDEFLATNQSIAYNTSWMMVVQWIDACPYCGDGCTCSDINSFNTFQLVLTTDGISSYAIFTYDCLQHDWSDPDTVIGFNAGEGLFRNRNSSELQCANSPGTRWSNIVYHVSGAKPNIVEVSYDIVIGDTVDVAVHCQAFGDPQPTISYTSTTGTIVATTQLDRYTRSSTLMITNATEDINIDCTATNVWGSTSKEIFHDIKVPPQILAHPESVIAEYSSSLQLSCAAKGSPIPVVQWLKDGEPISTSLYHNTNTMLTTSSILSLLFIEYSHNGTYQCQISNTEATITTEGGVVLVYTPLGLINSPTNVTMATGSTLRLECTFVSFPPPTIMWYQDDHMVSEGDVTVRAAGNITTSVLILDDVSDVASGVYRCLAELDIEGRPVERRCSENATITVIGSNSDTAVDDSDNLLGLQLDIIIIIIIIASGAALLLIVVAAIIITIVLIGCKIKNRNRKRREAAWAESNAPAVRERLYSEIPTMVRPNWPMDNRRPPMPAPRQTRNIGPSEISGVTGQAVVGVSRSLNSPEEPSQYIAMSPNVVYGKHCNSQNAVGTTYDYTQQRVPIDRDESDIVVNPLYGPAASESAAEYY